MGTSRCQVFLTSFEMGEFLKGDSLAPKRAQEDYIFGNTCTICLMFTGNVALIMVNNS